MIRIFLLFCVVSTADAKPRDEATVFAAASLSEAFREAAREVTRRTGYTYRLHFAGSQQLAAQLEQGAPADVFASADDRWMSYVASRQLVEGEGTRFTRNRLVVVTPKSNPGRVDKLPDLARRGVKVLIGVESVPVGRYARQVMNNLGADFAHRALANVVSQEENVKAIVTKVQLGEADAGFVYVSDVTRSVRQLPIPDAANVTAEYPIAIVRGAAHREAARAFVDFLLSADGKAVLARHGFRP